MDIYKLFSLSLMLISASCQRSNVDLSSDANGTLEQNYSNKGSEDGTEADPKYESYTTPSGALVQGDVVVFSGNGAQIGEQQGEHFKVETNALIDNWLNPVVARAPYLARIVVHAKADTMAKQIPVDFSQEKAAFAQAAGVSETDLRLADSVADIMQHLGAGNIFGCSSFIVQPESSHTGGMILGRNLDYHDSLILADYWKPVLFKKTGVLKVLSIHLPGISGVLNGINERGVSMMIHVSTGSTSSIGIPATIGFRYVLERAESTQHAVELIKQQNWTFGMNIIVGDGKDSAIVEVDSKMAVSRGPDTKGVLYATNHYRNSTMNNGSLAAEGDRWKTMTAATKIKTKYTVDDVKAIIGEVGGFEGTQIETNILALVIDYENKNIFFTSDPNGRKKAIYGGRAFSLNYQQIFDHNQ
ncbi:C45 family peptidase [Oligoflexaceae bacterium]|nr:C45 family peptidase [Oligoflexaceae bacterium]